jgi:hypothetical protein
MSNAFDPNSLVFEAIPEAAKRPPGKGREPVAWETLLEPLEAKLLETPARLWVYAAKTGAMSRLAAVRDRLTSTVPQKNWELRVRQVPGTGDTEENPAQFGVYAVFHGDYTPEQVMQNAQARQKRRDAIAKAREAKANTATPEVATESASAAQATQTPKERLASAAKK